MNYETTQQAAARLGISMPTIRRWAKEGMIPGAVRHGRSWRIPADFDPAKLDRSPSGQAKAQDASALRVAMPLMNSAYPVGSCRDFIETIPDEAFRTVAWGEYFYFSGHADLAAQTMDPYRDSDDPALRCSANLVWFFASLSRGHIEQAMQALERMREDLHGEGDIPPAQQAIGVFAVTACSVLLHLPVREGVELQQYLPLLPEGMRLWACYLLAHRMYLERNYHGSLAVAELALSLTAQQYPVASIYLQLVCVMNLMGLRRVNEAKLHMAQAWSLARPDGLIEPFGEHHGLLAGMIERFFQKDAPETYERIIAITYTFSAGWRKIHRLLARQEVADNLTTTEFTIAMLYNRGWTAKEIAAYMSLSPRTITNAIQVIYQKLGISGKKELNRFMLA
ncbi:MAG: helix-turn-helix domain-containing protein [Aristaeellaceae bacterium]